ncbi:MAG: aminotransferase class V-fold PLP-dependent enzyme [Bacteroidota bacterium]
MSAPTTTSLLDLAYNVNHFRQMGHELIDLLANQLEKSLNREDEVIPFRTPAEELAFWQEQLNKKTSPSETFQAILDHSTKVHHPGYMGHQIGVPALIAPFGGLLSDVLANGTGVFEMGMASNGLERLITDWLCRKVGYAAGAGFMTSGGTLANLTAMLAARKAKAPTEVWEEGHHEKLAIMVSAEAHYCIDRAARIMGMGTEGIIKVPVDRQFKIRTDLLEPMLQQAKDKGLTVIAVAGCAGSTATGSYDDLQALARFSHKHNLWFHVDGAHGGAVVCSEVHKHLVQGIQEADTIAIDFHKMMMSPALTTALLFKREEDPFKTFQQRAQYLWDSEQSYEWYHSGKRTFECTKLMLSVRVYLILTTYGEQIFGESVERLHATAKTFAAMLEEHPSFELLLQPEANIVNFRYVREDFQDLDRVNAHIRQQLVENKQHYIVQTTIQGKRYLRTALMNPFTNENDLRDLLKELASLGDQC